MKLKKTHLTLLWGASIIITILIGNFVYSNIAQNNNANKFKHLSPKVSAENFKEKFWSLSDLRNKIIMDEKDNAENFAFYIEDLTTGSWVGYQENEKFIGASLLKTPVALMVMRRVDEGIWDMNTKFILKPELKDKSFGNLWREPDGKEITLRELMEQMFIYSDDTAANIFINSIPGSERDNVYYRIGITNPEAPIIADPSRPLFRKMSAKELISVYRTLYNANYLTAESSEYVLDLLTKTKFDKSLRYGVPSDIEVAHKVGVYFLTGNPERNAHDCGIVYLPEHPYMLCAMTENLSQDEAWRTVSEISRVTYEYFNQLQ